MDLRICLLGFGEVGQILANDIARQGFALSVWDVRFAQPDSVPSRAIAGCQGIRQASAAHDAARGADVILCAVTAEQTLAATRAVAGALAPQAWFVDMNSVSPAIKQQAASMIHIGHGRYVEAAVMSAFPGKRLTVPINLGGPHAGAFLEVAQALGLTGTRVFSDQIGPASAAKMCRSIMIKGMEALVLESMLTARHHGVEQAVLDSLADLLPSPDWRSLARYMISRALLHGRRRAEEMREACHTVAGARLVPLMSRAIAQRQAWAGEHGVPPGMSLDWESLERLLDALRGHLTETQAPT